MREHGKHLMLIVLLLSSVSGMSLAEEILRDPTRPFVASDHAAVAVVGFAVNAIIVSSDRRVAIVNGQRVSVGGVVNGATVITIEKNRLILEKDGERITTTLNDRASRQ